MTKKRIMLFYRDDDDERSDPRLEVPNSESRGSYKHNRRLRYRWSPDDIFGGVTSCLRGCAVVYRHYNSVYRRYCREARLNHKQLDLIYALMIEGVSLREYARIQGVTPQAIHDRINRLAIKAPEFYRFWRNLNSSRRRGRERRRPSLSVKPS
jgi:hypothetical protein